MQRGQHHLNQRSGPAGESTLWANEKGDDDFTETGETCCSAVRGSTPAERFYYVVNFFQLMLPACYLMFDCGDFFAARCFGMKWNHIVIWHAVFWLFSRNVPYLLNFSVPL